MKWIPNIISITRFVLVTFLIFLQPLSLEFYLVYLLCGLSDMADGYLARKFHVESLIGAKIDSVADFYMVWVVIILLFPFIVIPNGLIYWIGAIVLLRFISIGVAYRKYKTLSILHSYSNKMTGMLLFLFPFALHSYFFMVLICIMGSFSAIEELVIHLKSKKLDVNKKSLFLSCFLVTMSLAFLGCSQKQENLLIEDDRKTSVEDTAFEGLDIPTHYDLKKFDGMTLNFIVENNLYANILLHESDEFSKVTGININIVNVDYDTLFQKLNIDFISRSGKYQVVYVDPYQTLNRFSDYLEPLNQYNSSKEYPGIQGFPEDFFDFQVDVILSFSNDETTYAIPFDTTTMILFYRKDIFEKYREQFRLEMGYDWMPSHSDFTWERYIEVAKWIEENVSDDEVRYGSGHMAQEHNSIFCDFSNVLSAYGGEYFDEEDITTIGQGSFNNVAVKDPKFIEALSMYKRVVQASAPESKNWNWTDSAEAFRNGEIAMMPNWDENSSYLEDMNNSRVAGKVGYAILPKGPFGSANIYGGSGIGINKYISEDEKEAAWLFITWATSKEMQEKVFSHIEGGNLPVRQSHYYDLGYAKRNDEDTFVLLPKKSNMSLRDEQVYAVLESWTEENIYLRPKISNFYEVEKVLISALHKMVEEDMDPEYISHQIYNQLQLIKLREREYID